MSQKDARVVSIDGDANPPNLDFEIEDDLLPLARPGYHDLVLEGFETALMFQGKAPKLIMYFKIVSMGKDFEKVLPRYYNVSRVIGKPQKEGRFIVGKKGDFLREYLTLFRHPANRLDRLPMSLFSNVIILGEVKTVKFSRGQPIPEQLQYSKIARLIKVKK